MPRFGDELARVLLALNAKPGDVEGLRLAGNRYDATAAHVGEWVASGRGLSADRGHFDNLSCNLGPFEYLYIVRSTSQTIGNGSNTAIQFDIVKGSNLSGHLSWSIDDPTKIYVGDLEVPRFLTVQGSVAFASNANGYRAAVCALFDADDVSLGGRTLACLPAVNGTNTTLPYAEQMKPELGDKPGKYVQLQALQNSGGNLNVTYASMLVTLVYSKTRS